MRMILNVSELAYHRWEMLDRPADSSLGDWFAAERLRHQVVEEAAYFRWLNRGRPLDDPWTDWFVSVAEGFNRGWRLALGLIPW